MLLRPVCSLGLGLAAGLLSACYSDSSGTRPPSDEFYFPVGVAVSKGGGVLYVANSDFDLQYNGGTLQSYDLLGIREHTARTMANPADPALPLVYPPSTAQCSLGSIPVYRGDGSGTRQAIGQTCAPPVQSHPYLRDSAVVSAFATDLRLSTSGNRLFFPVRGNASVMWADVVPDDSTQVASSANFSMDCGVRIDGRCDALHQAGVVATEPGNTRGLTLPGEPFGMAFLPDDTGIALTHQTATYTSFVLSGLDPTGTRLSSPSLQYVTDGVPNGGNGIASVPHDPDAYPECALDGASEGCMRTNPRPAFLQTSRSAGSLVLLRHYNDDGTKGASSQYRPYLVPERTFNLAATSVGFDLRGIAFDASCRVACRARISAGLSDIDQRNAKTECARLPARVFVANRSTSNSYGSLLVGEVGQVRRDGTFDADEFRQITTIPMLGGPSRVHLAPIVDVDGNLTLKVFVVGFDSNRITIVDPVSLRVETSVIVGQGPYALAFDPFTESDAAARKTVEVDPRIQAPLSVLRYQFAYVASFTNSYIQVIDLNNAGQSPTFGKVVFTLGAPIYPKGTL